MASYLWRPLQGLRTGFLSLAAVRTAAMMAPPLLAFRRRIVSPPQPAVYHPPKSFQVQVGREAVTVECIANGAFSLQDFIHTKTLDSQGREDRQDPFYVVNLGALVDRYRRWLKALPSIHPFYAVKCNPDPLILKTLNALGAGFDCASKNELKLLLRLGASPIRMIYANPIKQLSHLQFSARNNVDLMTFDGEEELYNIKSAFPTAQVLLRIRADDPDSIFPAFGIKFGCSLPEAYHLIHVAKGLDLNLVGVAFHVSSLSQNPLAYSSALQTAAKVFDYASQQGYRLKLLDIGGGYPGYERMQDLFQQQADQITEGLKSFANYPDVRVISEPGYFLACPTHTLAVNVIGKKIIEERKVPKVFKYYCSDGMFGSFLLSGLLNLQLFQPTVLKQTPPGAPLYKSSLWGPSCACIDKICEAELPELHIGDWIHFTEMGAYTTAIATEFNGFLKPRKYYCIPEEHYDNLATLLSSNDNHTIH